MSTRIRLARAFLQSRPEPVEAPTKETDLEVLGATLEAAYEAGASAWPKVGLEPEVFARHLGAYLEQGDDVAPARGADWYLACGCTNGDAAALAYVEEHYMPKLASSLRRLRLSPAELDEALQRIRNETFVAEPGREPRIARYSARGDLNGWLRVTGMRSALKMFRGKRRDVPLEEEQLAERLPVGGDSPDLQYMKDMYRPAFRVAFQEALSSLEPRERTLLKQNLLDGMSIDQIAKVYQVHRATAARWLSSARQSLMDGTRGRFQSKLGIDDGECDSIMRMIRSRLDITIRRTLTEEGEVG